jgi:hypothetical protein
MRVAFEIPPKMLVSDNSRFNRYEKARRTHALRLMGGEAPAPPLKWNPERPCEITIIMNPPTRRLYDLNNHSLTTKPLIDGLRDRGYFTDDNITVIRRMTLLAGKVGLSKGKWVVTFEIEDFNV